MEIPFCAWLHVKILKTIIHGIRTVNPAPDIFLWIWLLSAKCTIFSHTYLCLEYHGKHWTCGLAGLTVGLCEMGWGANMTGLYLQSIFTLSGWSVGAYTCTGLSGNEWDVETGEGPANAIGVLLSRQGVELRDVFKSRGFKSEAPTWLSSATSKSTSIPTLSV